MDASVAVKWFAEEDGSDRARELLSAGGPFGAPDLIFAETANVLWLKWRKGFLGAPQVQAACEDLPHFVTEVFPVTPLLARASELSLALNHPAYDCFYLACAERSDAPLVTDDRPLIAAAQRGGLGRHVTPLHA